MVSHQNLNWDTKLSSENFDEFIKWTVKKVDLFIQVVNLLKRFSVIGLTVF